MSGLGVAVCALNSAVAVSGIRSSFLSSALKTADEGKGFEGLRFRG